MAGEDTGGWVRDWVWEDVAVRCVGGNKGLECGGEEGREGGSGVKRGDEGGEG